MRTIKQAAKAGHAKGTLAVELKLKKLYKKHKLNKVIKYNYSIKYKDHNSMMYVSLYYFDILEIRLIRANIKDRVDKTYILVHTKQGTFVQITANLSKLQKCIDWYLACEKESKVYNY